MRGVMIFGLIVSAAIISSCALAKPTMCLEVISPFVEDPIILPPDLSDNVGVCVLKAGVYGIHKECTTLAMVRRYIETHPELKAE